VSRRSQPEYIAALQWLEDLPTKMGRPVGDLLVSAISARAADKLYAAVRVGPRGPRVRQANLSIDIVARLYPEEVPNQNPFRGVLRVHTRQIKPAASRAEAYALSRASESDPACAREVHIGVEKIREAPAPFHTTARAIL